MTRSLQSNQGRSLEFLWEKSDHYWETMECWVFGVLTGGQVVDTRSFLKQVRLRRETELFFQAIDPSISLQNALLDSACFSTACKQGGDTGVSQLVEIIRLGLFDPACMQQLVATLGYSILIPSTGPDPRSPKLPNGKRNMSTTTTIGCSYCCC